MTFSPAGLSRAGRAAVLITVALAAGTGCQHGPRRVDSGIMKRDAVWKGRVEIRGIVMVDRTAHLRIEPGTEVVFIHVDEDGDGIGDGELNVLGRLTAVGTPGEPIVFRSERGRKKDWTFVYLTGNRDSRIENCVFRDAFTGIQLHYVRADISNCLFVNNHEGMRYSTIRGTIRHNTFVDNSVGLRFEGRKSTVTVERNLFRNNGIAVFPVVGGGPDDRFRRNNFVSKDYNVRLGIDQKGDLDFRENHWGASGAEDVLGTIFDGRSDPHLGTVAVEPFLPEPVADAGVETPLSYGIGE